MRNRKRNQPVSIAQDVPLDLTGIAYGGEAIGRYEGEVVFVAGGIPGEHVTVDLYRQRKDLLRGSIRNIIDASTDRVAAPCPYFGFCGGCQWQHIGYERQLPLKARIVAEQLQHIGGFLDPRVRDTLPSPRPWHYRNNVRFSVGRHGHLGFTRPCSRRFLAVDHCLIAHEKINDVLVEVQGRGKGLRQVVVRVGENTGDLLLYPAMETVKQLAPLRHTELDETLLEHRFHISLSSFFQVNTLQAERLAEVVLQRLGLTGRERVVDAYCGVGTFAALIATHAGHVVGIEESPSAIRDAERNLAGVANVTLTHGKVEEVLPRLSLPVDAVVLDPARVGCAPPVIEAIVRLRPAKLVYVSCDPATLARDLRLLSQYGYALLEVQPIDMFPQTYHIENVAYLSGAESGA